MRRHPFRLRLIFATTRRKSRAEAVGRRIPIEFTQRIRFFWDRIRMMCVLLVGSPPQSCAKQMIDLCSSMSGRADTRGGFHSVRFDKHPVPEGHQYNPEKSATEILSAMLVPGDQRLQFLLAEERTSRTILEKKPARVSP